jgi:nucleoside-diphosphate-sugar epimerase
MNKKNILVTGATGQIGHGLIPALRKKFRKDTVIATGHRRKPSDKILELGPFEYIDVTDKENIEKIVKKFDINTIYHLAGVLSATGEENPKLAWEVNMNGLYNILEVAREYNIGRIFWPSSIAVFGPEVHRYNTPQDTNLIPRTMYGVTKVAGELLCNYYFNRYNLDVRSVRYPGIISSEQFPGGGTTDYAVEIFYEAIKNKHYTCFVRKDTVLPMMFMPDCIKAAIELMEADISKVNHRTSYNIAAVSFSVEELVTEIQKHIPEFKCQYKPDFRQKIADSWPMSIDDTIARKEWGWQPTYDLSLITKNMIDSLSKKFGITLSKS